MDTRTINQILEVFLYSRQLIVIKQIEFLKMVAGASLQSSLLNIELEEITRQREKLNK